MPSKKGRPEPPWQVILEDIRSQNRTTLDAVEATRTALTERIDRFEERTELRFTVVEAAVRSNSDGIAALDQRMGGLEGTMGGLERRMGSPGIIFVGAFVILAVQHSKPYYLGAPLPRPADRAPESGEPAQQLLLLGPRAG